MNTATPARPLRGIIPPLVTPLRDRDQLDLPGLSRLVNHVIAGGVSGLFVLGTTGEGPSLSYRTRYELVEQTCEMAAGRVPVLVGITDTSLSEALELAGHAHASGASAVVSAPPYYLPQSQAEVVRYFAALAAESALPLYLYNMPACCKTEIEFSTAEACTAWPNVCGIKDSGGSLESFRQFLALRAARPDWSFFIGPEKFMAEAVLLGGDGGVNGGSNLLPRLLVSLFHAADTRDTARVAELQSQVLLLNRIFRVGEFAGVARGLKCALALAGICSSRMAEPFVAHDEAAGRAIAQLLSELNAEWLVPSCQGATDPAPC